MRTRAGTADSSHGETVEDVTLRGLDQLLTFLEHLDAERAAKRAALLWDALCDVVDRRGSSVFLGTYKWFYFQPRSCAFDAAFVQRLNETAWVPDRGGKLQPPGFVVFGETGWKENPFLLSKIRFKPPIIEALAREAGIEPGVLDLLKKLGVTSEAELKTRLGIKEEPQQPDGVPGTETVDEALEKLLGDAPEPTPPVPDPAGAKQTGAGGGRTGTAGAAVGGGSGERGGSGTAAVGPGGGGAKAAGTSGGGHKRTQGNSAAARFVSYIGTHPDDEEPDPDGLAHQERLALEEKAIALILAHEPELQCTPTNNPGFDLVAADGSGAHVKWVEVKAMTGTMEDRPAGLSRTQFGAAQEHGSAYWLYVVEHAGSSDQARIVRIQDPAGRARTFTFDHGWLRIAELDDTTGPTTEEHGEQ